MDYYLLSRCMTDTNKPFKCRFRPLARPDVIRDFSDAVSSMDIFTSIGLNSNLDEILGNKRDPETGGNDIVDISDDGHDSGLLRNTKRLSQEATDVKLFRDTFSANQEEELTPLPRMPTLLPTPLPAYNHLVRNEGNHTVEEDGQSDVRFQMEPVMESNLIEPSQTNPKAYPAEDNINVLLAYAHQLREMLKSRGVEPPPLPPLLQRNSGLQETPSVLSLARTNQTIKEIHNNDAFNLGENATAGSVAFTPMSDRSESNDTGISVDSKPTKPLDTPTRDEVQNKSMERDVADDENEDPPMASEELFRPMVLPKIVHIMQDGAGDGDNKLLINKNESSMRNIYQSYNVRQKGSRMKEKAYQVYDSNNNYKTGMGIKFIEFIYINILSYFNLSNY